MCGRTEPLQGAMDSADFEKDTVTFKMHGEYFARAGTYIMLPKAEYEELVRNQKVRDPADFMRQMQERG